MVTEFSPRTKTYVVTLTPETSLEKLKTMADALSRMDADTVALWSIAPFDVESSADWPIINDLFSRIGRRPMVVEVVTQSDVEQASNTVSVMK